jgi:hypothetical protein
VDADMNLLETLKKQGGTKLVWQYWQSGVLFFAVCELLLLGKDVKALEILRLSVQYKIKRKLEKRYRNKINEFEKLYDEKNSHMQCEKVWVCWFQGMENAPDIVQKCYASLKDNLTDREIILITTKNMSQYVEFPDYIIEKWNAGQISHTHMTDLLRLELLTTYGGMWLDATVLCTSRREEIPEYYFDSELFLYQTLKPGRDGQAILMSSWLISAKSHNKILEMTKYLCYEYWKTNTKLLDYFLMHVFLSIALEHNPAEWSHIIPKDNATPHILLLRLFDKYDEQIWNAIKAQNCFHKLTYKFDMEKTKIKGTYYDVLLRG